MEAVSTGWAAFYVVALFGWLIGPAIVTALKGQWIFLALGLLTGGFVWWIVALRLAQPRSRWARRVYDAGKLGRAEARYGRVRPEMDG